METGHTEVIQMQNLALNFVGNFFWSKRVNFMHFFKVYKVLNIITNRQLTTMCRNPIKVTHLHEKKDY